MGVCTVQLLLHNKKYAPKYHAFAKMHQNGSKSLAKADCKELEEAAPPVALPRFSVERAAEGLATTSSLVFKCYIQWEEHLNLQRRIQVVLRESKLL